MAPFYSNAGKLPIFLALDTHDIETARAWAERFAGRITGIKLGLEFFCAHGPEGIRSLTTNGLPVFLDLKLHDIPTTLHKTLISLSKLPIGWLTVHLSGGRAMLSEIMKWHKTQDLHPNPSAHAPFEILGVSMLTSLSEKDMEDLCAGKTIQEQTVNLIRLGWAAGCRAFVCAATDAARIRQELGTEPILFCPGIRPAGSLRDDQKRIMTPRHALAAGANYLVIGRPLTQHPQPERLLEEIAQELSAPLES